MRLESDAGDFVELVRREEASGVLRLAVSVQRAGFTGHADVWVLAEAWRAFVEALSALETHRRGEAILEGMSPGRAPARGARHRARWPPRRRGTPGVPLA